MVGVQVGMELVVDLSSGAVALRDGDDMGRFSLQALRREAADGGENGALGALAAALSVHDAGTVEPDGDAVIPPAAVQAVGRRSRGRRGRDRWTTDGKPASRPCSSMQPPPDGSPTTARSASMSNGGTESVRFSYAESMVDPSFYLPLARAAEEAGYDGMVVPDSICYPLESDSKYPFSPDHSREFLEDKPFIEPFSLIPAMGAVTERLRFITFVLKLPMRHPLLVAKQATSVAVMTGNRLALGVGSSPWPEDYELCDVPWEGRGRRMDEAVAIVRGLSAGGYFEYHGEVYDLPPVKISPTPDRATARSWSGATPRPHCGGRPAPTAGSTAAAIRPICPGSSSACSRCGRRQGTADRDFEVHVISLDAFSLDGIRRLEEQGVTDVIVGFRWPYTVGPDTEALQSKLDNLRRFADDVIAKVQS